MKHTLAVSSSGPSSKYAGISCLCVSSRRVFFYCSLLVLASTNVARNNSKIDLITDCGKRVVDLYNRSWTCTRCINDTVCRSTIYHSRCVMLVEKWSILSGNSSVSLNSLDDFLRFSGPREKHDVRIDNSTHLSEMNGYPQVST